MKTVLHWSGGKDSALALHRMQKAGAPPALLCTTLGLPQARVTMHGVREALLRQQAQCLGLPWQPLWLPAEATMTQYEATMRPALAALHQAGYTHAAYGDIYLEDLKAYRDAQLAEVGLAGHYPLWQAEPLALLEEFWAAGFRAVVVACNGRCLGESFCGRELDRAFVRDLPPGVDPCGEHGEFHTFVYDGPNFARPVSFARGQVVARSYGATQANPAWDTNFWFCDLEEAGAPLPE
jgi:uncharacterized protein (TIGR00290 family)